MVLFCMFSQLLSSIISCQDDESRSGIHNNAVISKFSDNVIIQLSRVHHNHHFESMSLIRLLHWLLSILAETIDCCSYILYSPWTSCRWIVFPTRLNETKRSRYLIYNERPSLIHRTRTFVPGMSTSTWKASQHGCLVYMFQPVQLRTEIWTSAKAMLCICISGKMVLKMKASQQTW